MTKEKAIIVGPQGATTFQGAEGVDFFRVATLKSALKLLAVGIIPTRGMTKTKALKIATEYTKNKYKTSEIQTAINDLEIILQSREAKLKSEDKIEFKK